MTTKKEAAHTPLPDELRLDSTESQIEQEASDEFFVQRCDFLSLPTDSFERTPQGGIRAKARFTKTGIFEYTKPDGSIRREYRPPDEVFDPESIKTLRDAPITIGHPKGGTVAPVNHKYLSVGHIGGEAGNEDGIYLGGDVVLQDEEAVTGAVTGGLSDLSSGYRSKLDMTPGVVPEGQPDAGKPYDCVQRQIKYNHVALLAPGKGRAGTDVSLRLDSNGHQLALDELEPPIKEETTMDLTPEEIEALKALAKSSPLLMKLAEVSASTPATPEVKSPPAVVKTDMDPASESKEPGSDAEPEPEVKVDEAAPPKAEPAKAEPAEIKTDSSESAPVPVTVSPEDNERLVMDSIEVRGQAIGVIGETYNASRKSNRQVMTDVILHVDSKFELAKDATDGEVKMAYQMALGRFEERADSKNELAKVQAATRLDSRDAPPTHSSISDMLAEKIQKAGK